MGYEPKQVLLLGVGGNGGAAQYSAQLANGLATQLETCTLLPDHIHTEFEELLDPAVTIHTYSGPTKEMPILGLEPHISSVIDRVKKLRSLIEQIRTINPDVIHIPFYTLGPTRAYLLPVLKALQFPVVGTVHDPQLHSGQESFVYGVDIQEKGRVLGGLLLDRTLVHGPETKKQAIQAGYQRESLRIVPHGIYTHFPQIDVETDPNQLLFFGNIRENKGYDRIPDIIDKISEQQPEISAVVAGKLSSSADEEWGKQTLRQLRNHDHIDLQQGYASTEETAKLFGQAAAVVLPYYDATTSGVLMIAYRYKTPVATTNVGDVSSYVKRDGTGLIANSNSIKGIAATTKQVLLDDDRRQWLLDNLENVNEQYSWRNIGKETVAIYQEIVP